MQIPYRKKILVLGKDGSLGSEFVRLLALDPGYECTFLGHSELDITDQEKVFDTIVQLVPDVVINCAAYNNVDKAEREDAELAMLTNGLASGFIASAAREIGAIFVNYSSNFVFSGKDPEGYKEEDKCYPVNVYGETKVRGEQETLANCDRSYVIRTSWLYGQSGTGPNSKLSFSDFILNRARDGQPIKCVTDQYGNPTWTRDLAKATLELINGDASFGIYHLINSGAANRFEWAKEVLRMNHFQDPITAIESIETADQAKRPKYGILCNTKTPELRHWKDALSAYFKEQAELKERLEGNTALDFLDGISDLFKPV